MCIRYVAHRTSFLSRQRDVIASFSFGAWGVQTCFLVYQRISPFYELLSLFTSTNSIIMSSPGQKRGTCGHIMALFDSHKKCARCREKGVGDNPGVKKLDCQICKAFTPSQVQQLATPTYKSRKERGEQQKMTESTSSATPTLVDPADPEVLPTGNDTTQLDQSPPGVRTDEFASESDSEAEMDREPASPASANAQGELPEDY